MKEERLMKILLATHVSEKGTRMTEQNQYAFKVLSDANKSEIKRAIEMLFEVKVSSVQVANVKGKSRKFGQIMGRRKSWKKAYIRLQDGYKINLTEGQA